MSFIHRKRIYGTELHSAPFIVALKYDMCVAVEIVDQSLMCYGQYQLVKEGHYLVGFYFPKRDEKAMDEGIIAREKLLVKSIE